MIKSNDVAQAAEMVEELDVLRAARKKLESGALECEQRDPTRKPGITMDECMRLDYPAAGVTVTIRPDSTEFPAACVLLGRYITEREEKLVELLSELGVDTSDVDKPEDAEGDGGEPGAAVAG